MLLLVLCIIVPAMVQWAQQESRGSTKILNTTVAFNLAQAAVDRGMWMVKSTTTTWASATAGTALAGYNFDTTYKDIAGGSYRIKITPVVVGGSSVTIVGEGRDNLTHETRSISAVYLNQTIYSPMMTQGILSWGEDLGVYWGPIMAQGNITLCDDNSVNQWAYPRKFARGIVQAWNCPGGTCASSCPMSTLYPRDTNGPMPPNTDNQEWWSLDTSIPELPIIDFTALRSSAQATGTLNVYGCKSTGASWDTRSACTTTATPHSQHFGYTANNSSGTISQPNASYVWFWDGDVTLSGSGNYPNYQGCGLRGIFIILGNLTIDTPGQYNYTGPVPPNAWREQQLILKQSGGGFTYDTSAAQEYPADTGLHQNAATFRFGTDTWVQAASGGQSVLATVGIRGFVYVGKNLTITQNMDFNGAVWVNGNVSASGGTITNYCCIYFDSTLQLPTLNVILMQQSWQEIPPSTTAWQ
jgi:hypothetical protein